MVTKHRVPHNDEMQFITALHSYVIWMSMMHLQVLLILTHSINTVEGLIIVSLSLFLEPSADIGIEDESDLWALVNNNLLS
jgi:hypothetical protein